MKSVDDYLKEFSNEVAVLTKAHFTWKYVNAVASADKQILTALKRTPSSWNIFLHSLQTTTFISLGRIFDPNSNSFSIHRLARYCSKNINEFDRTNLKIRKMDGDVKEPEWLEEYLNGAYYPNKGDIKRLREEISSHRTTYETKYKPIRNKVMAHKDFSKIGKNEELFGKTNITELEGIISFCNQVKLGIQEQYWNGRKITFTNDLIFDGHDQSAEKEVNDLLESLK
ncbi:hypothetical protein BCT47_18360 [Vibrio splendidus]|uniref:HEPN AbiU2-like domain-containing protein n=1 Tax=Vibrio splendidus TaxID=29497 RepID=A0AB35N0Y9_VIBSP|nr:hypothetical protein [Vibrio splendidus]MDP2502153.1 hypothetical protein [Vibrio splendidus]PMM75523.1 hypothetical protein BCT47_18360 [Vibrio splendidus]